MHMDLEFIQPPVEIPSVSFMSPNPMRISSRSPSYYCHLKRRRESRVSLNACVERKHPFSAAAEVQAEPEVSEIINSEIVHAKISLKNCISDTQDCDKDQENSRMESNAPVKEDDQIHVYMLDESSENEVVKVPVNDLQETLHLVAQNSSCQLYQHMGYIRYKERCNSLLTRS